MTSLQDERDLR